MDIYIVLPRSFSAQHGLNQSQQFPFGGDRLRDTAGKQSRYVDFYEREGILILIFRLKITL